MCWVVGMRGGIAGAKTPPSFARQTGYLSSAQGVKFSDVPAGMGALTAVPIAGWAQIFLFCGLLEKKFFKQDADCAPGDLAKFNWVRYDDAEVKERKLLSEIKNGRLAMMAIMGMMVQEQVSRRTRHRSPEACRPT